MGNLTLIAYHVMIQQLFVNIYLEIKPVNAFQKSLTVELQYVSHAIIHGL